METKHTKVPGTLTLQNADIYVIQSRLDQTSTTSGKFYCLSSDNVPTDQVDFESALLHEIGHAVGFQLTSEYFYDNSCAMYYGLQSGEKRRVLCAAEKQEYLDAYGTP